MLRFTLRRFGHTCLLLGFGSVFIFLILHMVPGDAATVMGGEDATPEDMARLRELYGLDEPLPVQFWNWASRALQGDLGESLISRRDVTDLIGASAMPTLQLALAGALVTIMFALPTGIAAARRAGRPVDTIISSWNALLIAVPGFWMGILGLIIFTLYLPWLPPGGWVPLSEDPVEWLRHIVMPAVVVGVNAAAVLSRFTRAEILEVLGEEHVRTARAKGVSDRLVVRRHGVRNAMIPVVTVFGLQLGGLLTGIVVIEQVFSWPGLGRLTIGAIISRDYTVVQGCLLVFVVVVVMVNFLTDVLYGYLDPRIRVSEVGTR